MKHCLLFPIVIGLIVLPSAHGWNARFAPEEANVSWPVPEDPSDRAVFFLSLEEDWGKNILIGEVQVEGALEETLFIAKLDDAGNVIWSKRQPQGIDSFEADLFLINERTLLSIHKINEGGVDKEVIGVFDPGNGFALKYGKILDTAGGDPLAEDEEDFGDLFPSFFRHYEGLSNGDLALIEMDGNLIHVLVLDPTGNQRFARVYEMPSGGGGLPVIPGFDFDFGTTYLDAGLTILDSGDYYLTTSGVDFLTQSSTSWVLRLSPDGSIVWQAGLDLDAFSIFPMPTPDGRVIISGFGGGPAINSFIAVLSPQGTVQFAKSIPNAMVFGSVFSHFQVSEGFLFNGLMPTSFSEDDFSGDGLILTLSESGDLQNAAAYSMGDFDQVLHIGTNDDGMYFELYGFSDDTGDATHGILAKSDHSLANWSTRSYLEELGPSASFSSFFSLSGQPFVANRDANQDWVYLYELDKDLNPVGDCPVFQDVSVAFYTPTITVQNLSLTVDNTSVTSTAWTNPPAMANHTFSLIDTPLVRETTCGDFGGGEGLPVGEWSRLDFTWIYGLTPEWGITTYMSYIWVPFLPYLYQVNTGWMYYLSSSGSDHVFYDWDLGWILANEGNGGWYYYFQSDVTSGAWANFSNPQP